MPLDIYSFYTPRERDFLRAETFEVGNFDETLVATTQSMIETMLLPNLEGHPQGVGLAAPQVGIAQKFFVMLTPEAILNGTLETMTMINPAIIESSKTTNSDMEGCLSIPGMLGRVIRPTDLKIEYSDLSGVRHGMALGGFSARVFQHEFDHLNGILFLDRTKDLYRKRLLK